MTEAKKVLKEGTNKVTVVGTLVEKNLEDKSYTNSQTGETVEQIVGTISVRTGENEVHQIRLRSNKLTKTGTENGLYKGYVTVRDEYISTADVAEAAKNGQQLVASQVSVDGKLTTNEYYGQDGQLRQFQQIEGKFVNRLRETDDPTPRAVFEVDILINGVKAEVIDGDDTDRALVDSLIPSYTGIFPYKFAVIEEGSGFFLDELQKGQTVKVYGNILNVKKEHKKLVEMAFGDPREEVTYTYVTESLINNAKPAYDEDSPLAFDLGQVKERLTKREVYLEQQKSRQNGSQVDNRPNAFGGAPTNNAPKKVDIPVDVKNLF